MASLILRLPHAHSDALPPLLSSPKQRWLNEITGSEWAAVSVLHALEAGALQTAKQLIEDALVADPDRTDGRRLDGLVADLVSAFWSMVGHRAAVFPMNSRAGHSDAVDTLQADLRMLIPMSRATSTTIDVRLKRMDETRVFDRLPVLTTVAVAVVGRLQPALALEAGHEDHFRHPSQLLRMTASRKVSACGAHGSR